MKIEVLNHASVKLSDDLIIYFDPYDIKRAYHDADYIFITHDHYDHYDLESIKKVSKETTKIIAPTCLKSIDPYLVVEPNNEYNLDNKIYFETIPSYNIGKQYHPKEKNYVGFNILLKGKTYYVMGDTDVTEEKLTSSILTVTADKIPNVYFLTGYSDFSLEGGMSYLAAYLENETMIAQYRTILNTILQKCKNYNIILNINLEGLFK